jgi:hypothetical protein
MVNRVLTIVLCRAGLTLAGKYADLASLNVGQVCTDIPNWQDNKLNDMNGKLVDRYAGTDNEMVALITDKECKMDVISDCVSAHQSGLISTIIKAAFPVVLPWVMLLLWIFFFMPCACCRCCRRCRCWCCCREDREARNFGKTKKIVIGIWATLFIAGFAVVAAFAALSGDQFKAGGEGAICEVYKFVDSTLNGYSPAPGAVDNLGQPLKEFVGMLPAIQTFADITDELNPGSSFLTGVEGLIDNTKTIENAVTMFNDRLKALKNTLQANAEKGLYYKCEFCLQVQLPIANIIDVLDQSVAGLVNSARSTVKEQLQGSAVEDIRKTLEQSQSPIQEIGTQVENSLGKIFIDNQDAVERTLDSVSMAALIIALTVILPGLLLVCTVTCGACCSRRETYRDPSIRPQNACHASTSWCVTCLWAFLVLLLASVLLIVGFLSASACIVMQDIDVYVEDLVSKADVNAKTQTQMVAIVKNCFNENGSGEFTNEIEIDLGNGNFQTLKEALDVTDTVNKPFDLLVSAIASQGASNLVNDPVLTEFFDTVEQWGLIYTVGNPGAIVQDTGANMQEPLVQKFLKLTPTCPALIVRDNAFTRQVSSLLETVPGTQPGELDVLGQEKFNADVIAGGYELVSGSSNTCHSSLDLVGGTGVEGTLRKLAKEAALVREGSFDCYSVTFATDVNGYEVGIEALIPCGGLGDLNDYNAFISAAVNDLRTAALDIDTASTNVQSQIVNDLQDLVKVAFLVPMQTVVDGINCQFLGIRWNSMITAICRTMVPGAMATAFCWLAIGVIAWAAILMEFNIWRRLKDNRSLWEDEVHRQRQ